MKLGTISLALILLICLWAAAVRPRSGPLLPIPAAEAAGSDNTFKRVWSVPVPGFRSAALSADGQYVAVVTSTGRDGGRTKLGLWRWASRPAMPLWTRPEPGAAQAAVSDRGGYILAWAAMNPAQTNISLRRGSDGARLLRAPLDGAIWTTQVSPDGQYAAISTGARSLYVLTLDDAPRVHRWTLPGLGNSLSFGPQDLSLTTATWDTSGVSSYTLRGAALWQFPAAPSMQAAFASRIFETQTAAGGSILGVSYANVGRGNITLFLWRAENGGAPVWRCPLGADASRPRAAVSADGRYVAVSFVRAVARGTHIALEQRLAFLDTRYPGVQWEQGNLLFSPQLVALSPGGDRITLTDGQHSLYNLNAQGRIVASYALRGPGAIRQITQTPNGRYILLYTSDSLLSLIQVGA